MFCLGGKPATVQVWAKEEDRPYYGETLFMRSY